jgi:hypothetical protein
MSEQARRWPKLSSVASAPAVLAAVGTDAAQADMGGDEPLGAPRAVGLAGAVAKRFQGWRGSRPRHRDLAADQAAGAGAIRAQLVAVCAVGTAPLAVAARSS